MNLRLKTFGTWNVSTYRPINQPRKNFYILLSDIAILYFVAISPKFEFLFRFWDSFITNKSLAIEFLVHSFESLRA